MPTKLQIASAFLAVAAVTDLVQSIRTYAAGKALIKENESLARDLAQAGNLIAYLAQMMEDHEIELDEFDLIAINDLITK